MLQQFPSYNCQSIPTTNQHTQTYFTINVKICLNRMIHTITDGTSRTGMAKLFLVLFHLRFCGFSSGSFLWVKFEPSMMSGTRQVSIRYFCVFAFWRLFCTFKNCVLRRISNVLEKRFSPSSSVMKSFCHQVFQIA